MAIREQGVGLDFKKVNIIKDALMNPLTTTLKNTLGTTLGVSNKGLLVYDTDLNRPEFWNGSAFVSISGTQSGLTPKGSVAFNAAEPSTPTVGDLYVFSTAGTNTWEGSNAVQVGDQIWWDGTVWNILQGNVIQATEAIAGIMALATQSEATTGTDDTKAVTPLKLAGVIAAKKLSRFFFNSSVTTVADTPLTINHGLNLSNRDAFVLSFKVGNSEVMVDVDSTDANNCTITTGTAMTGSVTIIGF